MKKREIFLSLLSGILLVLSFPNFDLEFLAWFALVPLFYSIEGKGLFHSFILGLLTGFISFIGILYWIIVAVHTYGNIPLILSGLILLLLVIYLSLFMGTFTFLTRLIQLRSGLQTILFTPVLWVSFEYLRSFLLTGFPWASLGHSQYMNLPFIQIADITGVYGLSFALLLVNATLFEVLRQWPQKTFPLKEIALTVLVLLGFLIYGYGMMRAMDRQISYQPSLKVGLVQGNIDQSIKWDKSFQKETLKIYEKLTFKVAEGKPDLIIWPETATPFFFQDAKEFQPIVLDIPKRTNAYLLFGTPSYRIEKGKVNHYNSAYLASPSGMLMGKYDKIHLVPFGEYVPLGAILSLGSLGEGIGDFKSGKEVVNLSLSQGKFGVLICFEIIFPDLCRRFVKEGADFLVTITNDAWFGRTSAPYQHLSIATFRAVENRVFIARAANTGISAFIDPKGRIAKQGGIFTEETMNGTIRLMKTKTFYTLYGDVFAWICSVLSIFLLGYALIQKRSTRYLKVLSITAMVIAVVVSISSVFSYAQNKEQNAPHRSEASNTFAPIWYDLQQRTAFPFTIPLPSPIPTILDGAYTKFELKETPPVHCRRCPDYAPEGGIWRLRLDKGVFRIFHEVSGWRSIGSFIVTKDEGATPRSGQLVLANDPTCQEVIGVYTWKLEEGKLILKGIEDKCAIGLRVMNLTNLPWLSCQPPNTEAAISDHWPKPRGCD